jgi:uncharacterized Zn finger protein
MYRKGIAMSALHEFPTCHVCRSVNLEIVSNDEYGPITQCGECGYSWITKFEDITSTIIITISS